MKRLTPKQKWFKKISLGKKDQIYVGLDVHKKSISVAIWRNGVVELVYNTSPDPQRLIQQLQPLVPALKQIVKVKNRNLNWCFEHE